MNRDLEIKLGSTVVNRINTARMSNAERQSALNALRDAYVLVDALVWVAKKIERLGDRLFLKPAH